MSFLKRWHLKKSSPKNHLDQTLVLHLSKSRIPGPRQIKYLGKFLSVKERIIVYLCLLVGLGALAFISFTFYKQKVELVPAAGNSYEEGLVGNPQYINPLYASLNDADADLEKLIFSRLFTKDEAGHMIPDLVESFSLSDDKKAYTIKLRPAYWHNGNPVTVDDVIFTFNTLINPDYKSPLKDRYTGVSLTKLDDQTIVFNLQEPYREFPRLLDFGIMPASEWEAITSETITLTELNIKPIGSGPFSFKSLIKSKNGTIRSYTIERNKNYYGTASYLDEITFKFFPTKEEMIAALNNGQISGLTYLDSERASSIITKNSLDYHQVALPELVALFFNLKSKNLINDKKIRQALAAALDQDFLTQKTVGRWGIASQTLLPSFVPGNDNLFKFDPEKTKNLLAETGWQKKTITEQDLEQAKQEPANGEIIKVGVGEWYFKDNKALIIYLVAPEKFKNLADNIVASWQELGIKTELSLKTNDDFTKDILNTGQFEALLYSMTINQGDPYSLWQKDSSQNISGWNKPEIAQALEEARLSDEITAADRYHHFLAAAADEVPASPLYWQAYVYPQSKKIKGFNKQTLEDPSERFNQANYWYSKTDHAIKN